MVDVCRRVDAHALMSNQTWGFNEFHSALLRYSDQVGFSFSIAVSRWLERNFL